MGMDPHPASPTTGSVIFRHKKAGFLDIFSLIFRKKSLNSYDFVETNGSAPIHGGDPSQAPLIALILVVQKALDALSTPMQWAGIIIEFILNFFTLNNGIFGLIKRFITCSVVIPDREDAKFKSILGYVDGRTTLFKSNALMNFVPSLDSMHTQFDGINLQDLSIMSAKISYENEAFIKKAVTDDFKMHFVKFFSCWNKFLTTSTTQAFIFCNKEVDADLIVLAFRGTEFFSAKDWSTDIELSYLAMGKLGLVHMGFLKALGLQDETNYITGFPKTLDYNADKPVAYYAIREELSSLLKQHPNAKILITGHSLGGALAIVFPALLAMHDQSDILNSLYGVATYGQPRVGDAIFGSYVEIMMRLNYHRTVYRFDIVPRIPFDLSPFSVFKHCGTCIYYNGWYKGQMMLEAPNLNYFDPVFTISMYANALFDILKGLFAVFTPGKDYKEGMVSILFRCCGLILPGIASHSTRDYVNATRLGKINGKIMV